jgi:hypothetical protein
MKPNQSWPKHAPSPTTRTTVAPGWASPSGTRGRSEKSRDKSAWLGSSCLIVILVCAAVGCTTTRSISNSGYQEGDRSGVAAARELSEFDVLGLEPERAISEEEIVQTSARARRVALKENSSILLVQSGAVYPDGPMVTELSKHFSVVPFSGVAAETRQDPPPVQWKDASREAVVGTRAGSKVVLVPLARTESGVTKVEGRGNQSYSRLLRLAAARAGADAVVCYWGILESANERLPTKTISWVPVVSWVVPDEREHMRIRVKMAVVDVRTGSWTLFSPEPIERKAWSTSSRRGVVDQKQVESLKGQAYAASAKELVQRYAN